MLACRHGISMLAGMHASAELARPGHARRRAGQLWWSCAGDLPGPTRSPRTSPGRGAGLRGTTTGGYVSTSLDKSASHFRSAEGCLAADSNSTSVTGLKHAGGVATLEPGQALLVCERALRTLFTHAYQLAYGGGWLEKITTAEQRDKWAAKAKGEEHRTKKGIVDVPEAGLAYSEFYELVAIAEKHWEPLAAALGKQATVMPLLKVFERLRNTVGHNRQLYAYEQDLYSGIAGTIRNQVTIYMSTQDAAGEYYPRIEAAWDSFGNHVNCEANTGELAGSARCEQILHPGDIVTFTLVATDPQDRDIAWERRDAYPYETQVVKSGAEVHFTWTVTDEFVRESSILQFFMQVHDSPYHRCAGFDQRIYFEFTVRPPLAN